MDLANLSKLHQQVEPEPNPLPVHTPIEDPAVWDAIFQEVPEEEYQTNIKATSQQKGSS